MQSQDETWLLTEKYNGEKSEGFFTDCERLAAGEPLGYVIGFVPFLNCRIYLDSRPLIPRPETEFWVEKAITAIPRSDLGLARGRTLGETSRGETSGQIEVLDLCAGSGCIGVAVGKAVPEAHVTFTEIDPSHLSTIEKNCTTNHTVNSTIVQSDLFENVRSRFDFILSNPPYINPALDRAEPSVKNFEPHIALYGGEAGFELIEKIIVKAPLLLKSGGQLWLEHEPEQTALIASTAARAGFSHSTTHTDQYGVDRYSVLTVS